ncbi:Deoxyribodipyrimidine photolyase [uncultured Desulfobacterium sp.]|uniref:Deoxyribodipyrimidine photo-lyase n=1 Tax=uncultured Desulfobacterium sp. TaxID=201089 RepID=A0A445MV25_9BACT|nr:Deoxyribodipyrimidine photolyase [uncultured Desulfobacterium sp.]
MNDVPEVRITKANHRDINPNGDFILYWMTVFRRSHWNFSLQRTVEWAQSLKKPILVLEALNCDYPWASERFHRFLLDGMADNLSYFQSHRISYYPYVEPAKDAGKGLLISLSEKACVIVTDDFPCFFIPQMVKSVAANVSILMESVDSNGMLPLKAADRLFLTAYSFRRFLHKNLPDHLTQMPAREPLKEINLPPLKHPPESVFKSWPLASHNILATGSRSLSDLKIGHDVKPVTKGGPLTGRKILNSFLKDRLTRYAQRRNMPEENATSTLSPYIHFGHISVHEIFHKVMNTEGWFFDRLSERATGSKRGWWGVGESAEAFLDQLITWRELGFNMCRHRDDYDKYESLPEWAVETLRFHEMDKRDYIYTVEQFENGLTHDPLWNAAQIQLVREGTIHNYLRMLWGKKILEWSPNPRIALEIMIELNNKYALDGRDPNSYTGILWILGRYDRPWAPERPVFGKIRYMSSKNTARKVRVVDYIKKYAPKKIA